MFEAPLPDDETARLQALLDYDVLDTDTDRSFDDLTELVSDVLGVPIALVSLVDADRQWFKSRHGLDAAETPREIAFCGHAILQDGVFVVEDSHDDSRFADNPLVTGAPHVRFYAGAPLITPEGKNIGTVCGIDHEPHVLQPNQRRFLQIIARQVVALLELRMNIGKKNCLLDEQSRSLARAESVNKEIQDLVSVISHDLRAPVLNLVGFSNEIREGTRELDALVRKYQADLPETVYARIMQIIQDDLVDSLQHMQLSSRQIQDRIDAIVRLSRHSGGEMSDELVDLNALVGDVIENHSSVLSQLDANIKVDTLPVIVTKKLAVEVIVENLVANAIQYRSPDRELNVHLSVELGSRYFDISVKDNGRGVAADDLNKIFVMFRRVGKQDTKGDGSGLAYCRAVANRLGGQISCESVLGEGSTFNVRLPFFSESAERPRAVSRR